MIEISKITRDDLPELATLYGELLNLPTDPASMQVNFNKIEANPDYMLIGAKVACKLAGTLMAIVCNDLSGDGRPFMVIENVVVKNDHQRMGIGKQMMMFIEDYARGRDCSIIEFVSSSHRTNAHRFYETCGYKPDMVKGFRKFI